VKNGNALRLAILPILRHTKRHLPITPRITMQFYSRKWIMPEDLNPNGSLFGGRLLSWIDAEAAIFAMCQLGQDRHLVTKYISEINFVSSAKQGEIIEMGVGMVKVGRTSITLHAVVRNLETKAVIIEIDNIVFVNLGPDGKAVPHGYTPNP
jgi:acyl-CoA hydrolase